MKTYPESGECFRGAIAVRGYDNDDDKVEGVWRRALEKWLVVVTECPSASLIGDRVSRMSTTEAAETLRELFGRKSAATVLKRGSALVAFIAWCRKFFRDEEPMPSEPCTWKDTSGTSRRAIARRVLSLAFRKRSTLPSMLLEFLWP